MALSLVRGQSQRVRPPRVLHGEFPLGRPLGLPLDAEFQHRVLAHAFSLLEHRSGPVWEEFPDAIADEGVTPLECRIPPAPGAGSAAQAEARGLRSAWERQYAATGRTAFGRTLTTDTVVDAVGAFESIAAGAAWKEAGLTNVMDAAADIRAYYEEAAAALADHVPAARQAESWLYQQTETGRVLRDAQQAIRDADAPFPVWFYLRPMGQP